MNRIAKRAAAAALSLLTAFSLAACGGGTNTADPNATAGDATNAANTQAGGESTAAAGEDTIVIGMASDLATLDPGNAYEVYANMLTYALYDNLFKFQGTDISMPEPWLISDYSVADDHVTYTFTLKDNLKFSSGNPLTSADVAFSFNRVKNIKGNTSNMAEGIVSIETPDEKTIILKLAEPDGSFLIKLASNAFCVLDSAVLKENGGTDAEDAASADQARAFLDANSAGSGPYILKTWTPNVEIVLERNENYWGEPAKAQRIILKEIPDTNTQIQMLEKGEIDIALGLGADHMNQLQGKPDIVLSTAPTMTTTFLLMNMDEAVGGPLANPKVQQAIGYAINYQDLLMLSGEGSLLPKANVPIGFIGAQERAADYMDIEKAKQLLAEAGYADGFSTKMTVANFDSEGTSWTLLAQKLKDDLSKINVDVQIETGEIGTIISTYRDGQEGFLFMHWHPDYMDINNQLQFLPGDKVGMRANWKAGSNPELEALNQIIATELDQAKRAEESKQMQEMMANESPFVFLVQHSKVLGVRDDIEGVVYNDLFKVGMHTLSRKAAN